MPKEQVLAIKTFGANHQSSETYVRFIPANISCGFNHNHSEHIGTGITALHKKVQSCFHLHHGVLVYGKNVKKVPHYYACQMKVSGRYVWHSHDGNGIYTGSHRHVFWSIHGVPQGCRTYQRVDRDGLLSLVSGFAWWSSLLHITPISCLFWQLQMKNCHFKLSRKWLQMMTIYCIHMNRVWQEHGFR